MISRIYWHARLLRPFGGGTALNILITMPEQNDGSALDQARLGETWLVRRLGEVVPKEVGFGLYLTPKKSRPHCDRWKRQSQKRSIELIYPSIIVRATSGPSPAISKSMQGTYQQFVRGWSNIEHSSPRDYYASPKRPRPPLTWRLRSSTQATGVTLLHSVLDHFANHFTCSRNF